MHFKALCIELVGNSHAGPNLNQHVLSNGGFGPLFVALILATN